MPKFSKDQLISRADNIYLNHSVRSVYHPEWHTALAFYEGHQYKKWDKTIGRLVEKDPQTLTRKMTVNKIQSMVTTFAAHYLKELPTCVVNPNSNTPDDVNAANLAQDVLSVEYIPKLEQVLGEYFAWKYTIGTGIRGLFFDDSAAGEVKVPLYGEDQEAKIGDQIVTLPGIGQLYERIINPFNFFPVGGARIEDCQEILYVESLPIDVIAERFDFDAKPENVETNRMTGSYSRDYEEFHYETFEERANVFHYWRQSSKNLPKGFYGLVINKKIVMDKDNPYIAWGYPYPFFKSCSIPIPGRFWGKSPIELLRKTQIAYNYVYSLLIQTMERMGKLKWFVHKSNPIEEGALNSKIGEIVYYGGPTGTGQSPPMQANLNPVPYYYFQLLEWLEKAFEDISGFHEVKSARLPTGANNPSGVMVNLLLEQDETRLTPAIKEYTNSVKQESRLYLKMVQDLYTEDRILRIGGAEKESLIVDFRGSSLLGNDDVNIELAPILSESRSTWEQLVWKGLELGVMDPRTAIRKLKLEHPKTMLNELIDEQLALRENTEMRQGTERVVDEFHVDEIHLPIHEGFMKSKTYENLPNPIQGIFQGHRNLHLQNQAKKFQQQMAAMQQQNMAGQPGPSGQGQGQPGQPEGSGQVQPGQ